MGAWLAALWILFLAACGFFYTKMHKAEEHLGRLNELHHWIADEKVKDAAGVEHPGFYKSYMIDHVKLWSSGDPGAPPPPPPPMD
jgi:hypothetical protein